MRLFQTFSCLACVAFLAGCVTNTDSRPPGSAPLGQPAAWEVYTNGPSGFCFPNHVDAFKRDRVARYDRQEQDIGVGYNQLFNQIVMTVYVYSIPARGPDSTIEGHFEGCKHAVYDAHTDVRLLSEGPIQISPGGVQHDGKHAVLTYPEMFVGQVQPVCSEIYLFTNAQKFVLYRVTYPEKQQSKAEPEVSAFLNDLAWP